MPKFEDKFVRFRWDDKLKGKTVFYADCIPVLEYYVESNSQKQKGVVSDKGDPDKPFYFNDAGNYIFVYYDPHYEEKLDYEQGRKNQITKELVEFLNSRGLKLNLNLSVSGCREACAEALLFVSTNDGEDIELLNAISGTEGDFETLTVEN